MSKTFFHIICVILFGFCSQAYASNTLDRIIAVVNDSPITQSEFDSAMDLVKKQMASAGTPAIKESELHKKIMDQLIDRKLEMQIATQNNIKVTTSDVDKAIATVADNNKLSPNELYQKLAEQGLSKSEYRKEIQEQLILQRVQQAAIGKINVSEKEINDFLHSKQFQTENPTEYHLKDILIEVPESASKDAASDAKKLAEKIAKDIRQGTTSFDKAGGEVTDLGWRKEAEIPSIFADHIRSSKRGAVLGPVVAPNGFHIVQLVETRSAASNVKLSDERSQAQQILFQQKFDEALQGWLKKIRGDSFINMHPES